MADTIRAVVYEDRLQVIEREPPVAGPDEALIRLRLGGICNTDLELVRGYQEFRGTLGHEFVGEVVVGPRDWLGARVVGEINVGCGACDWCKRGVPNHCRNRRALGIANYEGAFADLFRLPVANLHRVPQNVADEEAVFTEPLAAACQVLDNAHIRPSERVVLLGAGKLGLLMAQVLGLLGCDLAVVVRHERQARMLAGWGLQAVRRSDLRDGEADVVVDCTGTPEGLRDALRLVRARGTLVLKSTYAGPATVDLAPLVVNEVKLVGSRCGPFGAALHLLERRLVDVLPLIEVRYPLAQALDAFARAAQPGTLKVLLTP
ncbi:MAG: alcohol dehydrogenase catalytic domain-containing protein [Anaerolineae bacterium]|nr:alcohol dehydrogenase catalytic domain-containing protein [Anaerolineae bacterium]